MRSHIVIMKQSKAERGSGRPRGKLRIMISSIRRRYTLCSPHRPHLERPRKRRSAERTRKLILITTQSLFTRLLQINRFLCERKQHFLVFAFRVSTIHQQSNRMKHVKMISLETSLVRIRKMFLAICSRATLKRSAESAGVARGKTNSPQPQLTATARRFKRENIDSADACAANIDLRSMR